jgi:hypothetical protein
MAKKDMALLNGSGQPVKAGDVLTTFRGEKWVLERWDLTPIVGKSGKAYVRSPDGKMTRSFYVTVFDLEYGGVK